MFLSFCISNKVNLQVTAVGGNGPSRRRPHYEGTFKLGHTQRVHTTPGYLHKEPPGPPLVCSPRQTNGILPAVLQQQLVQQSSVKKRKLLVSSAASRGPSPPVAPAPGPFRLDSPRDPASRVPIRTAAGTRVLASPAASPRPRGRRRPGQGEGRPRPAGPRGGRTPPPGPAAFPPSPFE